MIPLYSTAQVRKIDNIAINKIGIPGPVLMENASREIFYSIDTLINYSDKNIAFVCGKGNNGGDGFAAARHFFNAGYKVLVVQLGTEKEMSPDCKLNYSILKKLASGSSAVKIIKYKNNSSLKVLKNYNIICDALLGSGTKGSLKQPYLSIINYLNMLTAFKIAVDIPTGLNPDTGYAEDAFNADITVTLGGLKKGLFFEGGYVHCGDVIKGGIGIPDSLFDSFKTEDYLIEPEDAFEGIPVKKKNLHKYSAGKVLTIAGSGSLPGAAALTAKSTLKIGAGASILCFPKSIRSFIQKKLAEVVVDSYEDYDKGFLSDKNINELKNRLSWADVIAIGPGLGREKETQRAVIKILNNYRTKLKVIDADAIFALGKNRYRKVNLKNSVLTPHHGEFANLIGISVQELKKDILKYGKRFAKQTGAYLILKGAPTIIFTPSAEALINTAGNPALAKFGTGDVLTGFIAGLLSQQKDIEKAVVAGVYLHSLTADLLTYKNTEYTLLATDIITHLPQTINFLRRSIA